MPVILEFYSLIIRRDRLEALLPGGWPQYCAEYDEPPPGWVDDDLVRDGAMNPLAFNFLLEHWRGRGLVLQSTENGRKIWKDMVVDGSMMGLEVSGLTIKDCAWLEVLSDGTARFVGERKVPRRRKIRTNWSDELVQLTLDCCQAYLATPSDRRQDLPMKNWNGSFALLATDRFAKKSLVLTDRENWEDTRFRYVEDMLNAGWAID